MIEESLPRIMMEFYWGGISRIEFRTPYFDPEGQSSYPFGGVAVIRNSYGEDLWRVMILSPFPDKGWLHLKHPEYGWIIPSEIKAIQFARKMQP
jgi:hypothetical protein